MIHGFRGAPAGLSDIAELLRSAGYTVHIPAIPPFAGAPLLPEYTPETYANYLMDYAKENQLDRPVLIGHSMGSLVAASAVDKYPEAFANKLILLSPISRILPWPIRLVSPMQSVVPASIVDRVTTAYLLVDKSKRQDVLRQTAACSKETKISSRELVQAAKFSYGHAIPEFKLPDDTYIIMGAEDHLSSMQTAQALQGIKALNTIVAAGHLHNYEAPDITADYIIRCLQD